MQQHSTLKIRLLSQFQHRDEVFEPDLIICIEHAAPWVIAKNAKAIGAMPLTPLPNIWPIEINRPILVS